jgi:hypothetical protein
VKVARSGLRTTPEALWYSASLELTAPGPRARPEPTPHAF